MLNHKNTFEYTKTTILILFAIVSFLTFQSLSAQESIKIDSVKTKNGFAPNGTQAEEGDIKFSDGTNELLRITDEGTFGAIELKNGVPSATTNKLYNDSGTLKFNGSAIGGSSVTEINDLTDAKTDSESLYLGSGTGVYDNGLNKINVGVGKNALYHTTGSNNTAVGNSSLYTNTTGGNNVAVGVRSLYLNTIGYYNNAFGSSALFKNINGNYNIANGPYALYFNSAGSNNIAEGQYALYNNATGNNNIGIGMYANNYNQEGSNNTIIGAEAGKGTSAHNKSGSIFLGYQAGYYETSDNKLYIENSNSSTPLIWGNFAVDSIRINGGLHVTGSITSDGTSFGAAELNNLSDVKYDGSSLFLGEGTGLSDDGSSNANTGIGFNVLNSNTIGFRNIGIGNSTLEANLDGKWNVAIGYGSQLSNLSGYANTAIGNQSLLENTTGNNNTAIGNQSLQFNTTGNSNVGIGSAANTLNQSGSENTIIGYHAGYGASAHSKNGNVFLGFEAGYFETSDDKLYIENSNSSSPLIWGDFANDIAAVNGSFGVGTQSPSDKMSIAAATGQDAFRIQINGATKFRVFSNGGTAIGLNNSGGTPTDGLYVHGDLNYNGALTSVSDKRYKKNIELIENPLEKISKLRGVMYDWRREEFPERDFTDKKQIGVIAQEVEAVFPELVSTNQDGYKSVDYSKLTAILIESVKELEKQNEELRKQNSELSIQNAEFRNQISEVKNESAKIVKRFIELEKKVYTEKFAKVNN